MLKLKRCFSGLHGQLRSLILYSTSAASKDGTRNHLFVEYLVKSVGFSKDEAISVANKCKLNHRFKSPLKSELVVSFLKNSGFDETHIRKLIFSSPMVLHSKVEKTLKPKIRIFQELGFSGSDLGLMVSQQPRVLNRSLKAHIVPVLEILRSLIGSNDQLVRFLLKIKVQQVLSHEVRKNLPRNLLILQSYGLPRDKIKRFVLQRCHILLQSTPDFERLLKRVEENLGIPRTSGMFMYGIYALSWKSGDQLESWLQIFHNNYGWSKTETFNLLRKHPLALTVSEKELRLKLKYFIEDVAYGSDNLRKRPALLSYSLEKRIVPRTAVIKALTEKQLLKRYPSYYSFMAMNESEFINRFVLPFKNTLPELYQYYTKTTSRSL